VTLLFVPKLNIKTTSFFHMKKVEMIDELKVKKT